MIMSVANMPNICETFTMIFLNVENITDRGNLQHVSYELILRKYVIDLWQFVHGKLLR